MKTPLVQPTDAELKDLAQLRLEEAAVLFNAGQYDGCVYLCGYVVELALKAVICRHLAINPYPASHVFKVHNVDDLVLFAGLRAEIAVLSGPRAAFWQIVTSWDSAFRYKPRNSYNHEQAAVWLDALRNVDEGVLPWLQTKW